MLRDKVIRLFCEGRTLAKRRVSGHVIYLFARGLPCCTAHVWHLSEFADVAAYHRKPRAFIWSQHSEVQTPLQQKGAHP